MPFDPNGAIFWKGRYHLFYIFQDHRGHNWGHVSSTDLFHWRHHPTGLVSGMFSGNCFVNKDGRPTMCYHQVDQGNAMAVALDDELNQWEKLETNPITPKTEPGDPHHDQYRSWDPYGWLEGDTYYAIFGGERDPASPKRPASAARGSTSAISWPTPSPACRSTKTCPAPISSGSATGTCSSASATGSAAAITSATGRTSSSIPLSTRG